MDSNHQYSQGELPSQVFNSNDGDIKNYNGQAVQVYNNGNGTRKLVSLGGWDQYQTGQQTKQAQAQYQAAIGTAVSGLQAQGTSLDQQYGDLLKDVLGQGTVAMNTATRGENNLLAQRGITNNSPLYDQQMTAAQLPVTAQNQAAVGNLGYTQGQLKTGLATNIANLQAGGAGTASQIPLQYGSLALSQAANIANISLAGAQQKQAETGARYVTTPYGLYDIQTNQYVTGAGNLPTGGQVVQQNGQYFLSVP